MNKLVFVLIVIIVLAFSNAGDNIIIQSARLDGLFYGNASGATDTLIIPDVDSVGQYMFSNARDPINSLDVVNLRTLTNSTSNGWDSIPFDSGSGDLKVYLGAANVYTTSLDDRYIMYSDTTSLVPGYGEFQDSITAVKSLITEGLMKTIYTITLPINGTLSGSVAAATDFPDGWVLSASGGDLEINHGTGRYCTNVNVAYNSSGTAYRLLRNFDNGYSGVLNDDVNNVTVESISDFYTAYALKIFVILQ